MGIISSPKVLDTSCLDSIKLFNMVLIITKVKYKEYALCSTFQCKTEAECRKIIDQEQDSQYDDLFFEIYKRDKRK